MRTPLLRSLVHAVKKGKQELQQIEENPMDTSKISRRDLLKKGAFVATAAMVPNFLTSTLTPTKAAENKNIAIIGGGLAGLTAAFRLNQKGFPVTLFEGNSRLGGRCWSAGKGWGTGFTQDGQYEVGGELIDTIHTDLIDLIGELNKDYTKYLHNNNPIELQDMYLAELDGTHDLYYFNGKPYDYATAISDLKCILPFVQSDYRNIGTINYSRSTKLGKILDSMNLRDYIYGAPTKDYHSYTLAARAGNILKPELKKLLEIAYITEYGAEIEQQSSINLIYLFGSATARNPWIFGESDETYHIVGGNEVVARTLTNVIKDTGTTINLGHILTNISFNSNNQYVLTFKNGVKATFDIVICAIPFRILRDILSEDQMKSLGFSARKIDAVLNYPMGYNTKHYIQFNSRYWNTKQGNGSSMSDLSTQMTWETTRGQITTGSNTHNGAGILVNFTGGNQSYSVTQQNLSTVTQTAITDLDKFIPGISSTYANKTAMMPWPVWQFSKGAYAYYGPGHYTRFSGAEIENEGNMYFCGEHTSTAFQGYLNGAVETGEVVAKQIAQSLTGSLATIG